MTLTELMPPVRSETPIEETSAAKRVVDAFDYVQPTVTNAVKKSSLNKLLSPHGRREATESAIVWSHEPIAAPTAPMATLGDFIAVAYPYWLTIALKQPLATTTLTSFEAPGRWSAPAAAPPLELLRRHMTQAKAELQPKEPRAYRAFVELADWLEMTQEETARLLGMGRTTPLAWQREGHEPQPARARRLYQTHALVNTLRRRLGQDEMRRWLVTGDPSPFALIAQGDVSGADDLADELIFGASPSRERLGAWVEEPADMDVPAAEPKQGPPRRVRRRPPRRRTL